jgi:hypothetical protein
MRVTPIKITEDFQKDMRKFFSSFFSSSLSYADSAVVLSCFKLADPTPCRAQGEG